MALGINKEKAETFTKTFLKNMQTGEMKEHRPGEEISNNHAVVLKKYKRKGK